MNQPFRDDVENPNDIHDDIDSSHEDTALLSRVPAQNLTTILALSTTSPSPANQNPVIDLETYETVAQLHPDQPRADAASKAFYFISGAKLLSLAILMGAITSELKDPSTAVFIMMVATAGFAGLSDAILTPTARGFSNTISARTQERLLKLDMTNFALWAVTCVLAGLTYGASNYNLGFSAEWTGWSAVCTVMLEVATTIWSMLILGVELHSEPSTPHFGQRGSSTQFQPATTVSPINATHDLAQTHASAERTPLLLGQQP